MKTSPDTVCACSQSQAIDLVAKKSINLGAQSTLLLIVKSGDVIYVTLGFWQDDGVHFRSHFASSLAFASSHGMN